MDKDKRLKEILLILRSVRNYKRILQLGPKRQLFKEYDQSLNLVKTTVIKKKYHIFLRTNKSKVDLITFIKTLERFKDPQSILIKSRPLICKGGSVCVVTRNRNSFLIKNRKRKGEFDFFGKSIKLLLKHAGYKIKYFTTFDSMEDFKRSIKSNKMQLSWFSWVLYLIFRRVFWLLGSGGYICVVAEKFRKK